MTNNTNLAIAQKLSFVCARCGNLKHASAFAMQALDSGDLIRSDTCAACVVQIHDIRRDIQRTERAAAAVRNTHKSDTKAASGPMLDPIPFVANNGSGADNKPGACAHAMAA
jgi:hypothetical protein